MLSVYICLLSTHTLSLFVSFRNMSSKRKNTPTKLSKDMTSQDAYVSSPDAYMTSEGAYMTPSSRDRHSSLENGSDGASSHCADSDLDEGELLAPRERHMNHSGQYDTVILPASPTDGDDDLDSRPQTKKQRLLQSVGRCEGGQEGLGAGAGSDSESSDIMTFSNNSHHSSSNNNSQHHHNNNSHSNSSSPHHHLHNNHHHHSHLNNNNNNSPLPNSRPILHKKSMDNVLRRLSTKASENAALHPPGGVGGGGGGGGSCSTPGSDDELLDSVKTVINSASDDSEKEKRLSEMIAQLQTLKESLGHRKHKTQVCGGHHYLVYFRE